MNTATTIAALLSAHHDHVPHPDPWPVLVAVIIAAALGLALGVFEERKGRKGPRC